MICDDCSSIWTSSSEKISVELYSDELDIASFRVQERWQVSAAHFITLLHYPEPQHPYSQSP